MVDSPDYLQPFQSQGHVKLPGLIEIDKLDQILRALVTLLAYKDAEIAKFSGKFAPWEELDFHTAVMSLRQRDPRAFSEVYSAIKSSPALLSVFCDDAITSAAARLIDCDSKSMWIGEFLGRMDVPGDARNNLGWHQERWYYPQSADGHDAVVCWIPLQDTDSVLGSIRVCDGSHETGLDRYDSLDGGGSLASTTYRVPDEELAKFEPRTVDAKKGDVLFVHMHTFHRSGTNSTSKVRFTATGRFFNVNAPSWIPHELVLQKV